MYVYVV